MSRQNCCPILLPRDGGSVDLVPSVLRGADSSVLEADIQALVHAHPEALPIKEIDPLFVNPVPICTELVTPAGSIDNFMITPSGLPIIVECKLWRNAEARREVVGQILDYAKELRRWSSSDLQREVCRRLKISGNPILEFVRKVDPSVDEVQFNDAITSNLRRGRFLLLIVGDGIRESVEAIAEYLQDHAGLHFSLGLVELPIYTLPDGGRLVVPRVLARTVNIIRYVVASPQGLIVSEANNGPEEGETDPERRALANSQQQFWKEFLDGLTLDDPEQAVPSPYRMGYITFSLPAPNGSSWLTVYRDARKNEVGVFLSSSRNSAGEYAMQMAVEDWPAIKEQLGPTATLSKNREGRDRIGDSLVVVSLERPEDRARAFEWLRRRVNTFVNVLRPRVRSAVADFVAQ